MKNFISKSVLKVGAFPLLFVVLMWAVFFIDHAFNLHLTQLGTAPRTIKGLNGIIFSPFLHSDLEHLASNSLPMLVLGMLTFYFYKPIAWPSFIWIYIMSGVWLWVGGRNTPTGDMYHIGASGLIYGAAVFLFFSGVFRKHKPLMVISALVLFLYGGMMWGIFPIKQEISWEAHLFGAISGLMVAYNYRKEGPQRKEYEWENEDDDENEIIPKEEISEINETPTITYYFIPKQEENKEDENKKE